MEEMKIKCSECKRIFTQKKNLYAHLRKIHKVEPLCKHPAQWKTVICEVCKKNFSSKTTLSKHVKTFHKEYPNRDLLLSSSIRQSRLTCPYEKCNQNSATYILLRKHLYDSHNIEVELGEYSFGSIPEFEKWKRILEQQTLSMYTLDSSTKMLRNGVYKRYYNCHRSYKYKSKGNQVRATKSIGSNKIDKACPSRLEVTISKNDGISTVFTKFWKTHCGHAEQIERITLDKETRSKIAGKLKEGVSFDHILDSIRDAELTSDSFPRLCLLERKDMHNIVRDFHIDYATKQLKNYATSENDMKGLFPTKPTSRHDKAIQLQLI